MCKNEKARKLDGHAAGGPMKEKGKSTDGIAYVFEI